MQIYSSTGLLTFKSMFYHDFYSIFSAQNLSQHKARFKPEMEIMDKSHGLVVAINSSKLWSLKEYRNFIEEGNVDTILKKLI